MRYAMVMAGGSGTRLWPLSREDRPKQLLPIFEGRCLLELAAGRLEGLLPLERRLICSSRRFAKLIGDVLPQYGPDQLLSEPVGRDTANAVGLTAAVLARRDPEAIFAVLTADHLIEPLEEFQAKLAVGFELVEADPARLVTFSIQPTYPATCYGYVERGEPLPGHPEAFLTRRFVEKPDPEEARAFLASGLFSWNSGMFVFHARTFLEALRRFLPASHEGLQRIGDAWDRPDRDAVLVTTYPTLPRVSVDFGVMEPAAHDAAYRICTVSMQVRWMDVGSWPSYGETLAADTAGNRGLGRTIHLDSAGVLGVCAEPAHTIATIGCTGMIIVHTADATLVCPADQAERVKDLVDRLPESLR